MTDPRPRLVSRVIDVVSVILLVAGGTLYLNAYAAMKELRDRPHEEFVGGQTEYLGRVAEHSRLMKTSRMGLALAGLGLIVGVSAAVHARQVVRQDQVAKAG